MSIGRQMDKEFVINIHNGILLRYKMECIWLGSNEVDETRAYYTEWNKSERERQILSINAYIWNLKWWYWWSYMQDSKGKTDVKNNLLDSVAQGESGMIWENNIETYTLPYVKQMISVSWMAWSRAPKASTLGQHRGIGWGGRWEGEFKIGGTHVYLWLVPVDVWQNHHNIVK